MSDESRDGISMKTTGCSYDTHKRHQGKQKNDDDDDAIRLNNIPSEMFNFVSSLKKFK